MSVSDQIKKEMIAKAAINKAYKAWKAFDNIISEMEDIPNELHDIDDKLRRELVSIIIDSGMENMLWLSDAAIDNLD